MSEPVIQGGVKKRPSPGTHGRPVLDPQTQKEEHQSEANHPFPKKAKYVDDMTLYMAWHNWCLTEQIRFLRDFSMFQFSQNQMLMKQQTTLVQQQQQRNNERLQTNAQNSTSGENFITSIKEECSLANGAAQTQTGQSLNNRTIERTIENHSGSAKLHSYPARTTSTYFHKCQLTFKKLLKSDHDSISYSKFLAFKINESGIFFLFFNLHFCLFLVEVKMASFKRRLGAELIDFFFLLFVKIFVITYV